MLIEAARRPSSRRLRWRAWLAPMAVALLMHGWLLSGDAPNVGIDDASAAAPMPMQVRSIEAPVPLPIAAAALPVVVATQPLSPARPRVAPSTAPRMQRPVAMVIPSAAAAPAIPMAEPGPLPDAAPASVVAAVGVEAEIVKTAAGAAASGADEPLPTYRTLMPPPSTMHYQLRRGMFSGSGELAWKPSGEHYALRLEGSVAGLHVLTETSTGSLDAHGLAPLRYTDERIRRGVSAANFQRDKGKITYSGPQVEFPLPAGAQDRVSWMIQIAAVLNADPRIAAPGGRISLFVTGARGDADTWVFRYVGTETITGDDGLVRAVKFTREPRHAYDRLVEVWLAPAHHHLPVRAKLTATADGDIFELLLRDIRSP